MSPTASLTENWTIVATHDQKPHSLVIYLKRHIHILPWFHFRHAEGNDELIKITFSSHIVVIGGRGLTPLLKGIAGHRAAQITEPTSNEARFAVSAIQSIAVKAIEGESE